MPKGKTPSLIGSSLGRPEVVTAGRLSACSRCSAEITKGTRCFAVPQPSKPFGTPRRFCIACFGRVLDQTKLDMSEIQTTLDGVAAE